MAAVTTYKTVRAIAQAFLNHYYQETVTDEQLAGFCRLRDYAQEHQEVMLAISSPGCHGHSRMSAIEFLVKKLGLGKPEERLIGLLFERRLIGLLHSVCEQLITRAHVLRGEQLCTISSSHELNADEKEVVLAFIQKKAACIVIPTFILDHELIGGIRVKGQTFLWECSVAGHLNTLKTLSPT